METYEKKYKEALERAKKLASDLPNGRNDRIYHIWDLESIFPELVESEDEKIISTIRKALESKTEDLGNGVTKTACLAWLEKQASPVLSNSSNNGKDEQTCPDIEEAIKEVEEKAKAFTEAHKGESSDDILAQMRGEQKPAWSMRDEGNLWAAIFLATKALGKDSNVVNWLKSLKDRVQPTIAWNENDEVALESAATNYAQDKYLPVQTAQSFKAGARWVLQR